MARPRCRSSPLRRCFPPLPQRPPPPLARPFQHVVAPFPHSPPSPYPLPATLCRLAPFRCRCALAQFWHAPPPFPSALRGIPPIFHPCVPLSGGFHPHPPVVVSAHSCPPTALILNHRSQRPPISDFCTSSRPAPRPFTSALRWVVMLARRFVSQPTRLLGTPNGFLCLPTHSLPLLTLVVSVGLRI